MDYAAYIRAEWQGFLDDPNRALASREAVAGRSVTAVLDVGCGAGQELIPFQGPGVLRVGLDVSPNLGCVPWDADHESPTFIRGNGDSLPFAEASFDVVICRGALPYLDSRLALREMARVLRPRGVLLLKIVSATCMLRELRRGLASFDLGRSVHAAHLLVGGGVHLLLGVRPKTPFTRYGVQPERLLARELDRVGLRIVRPMPDSHRLGPSFLIEKRG